MREILFSGKRVDNDEWVEGFYVCVPEHYKSEMSGKSYIVSINNGISFEVIPETVREYTGLTDKNGKKIFEGDIVKNSRDVGLLYYKEKNSAFTVKGWEYGYWLWHDKEDIEVIGNIHDNPEMLEEI